MTPGIGRDADDVEARIVRRPVAFDVDGQADLPGGVLGRRDQFEIVLERLDRRHEDAEPAVARLDRDRRAHRAADLAKLLLDAVLLAGCGGERGLGLARAATAASTAGCRPARISARAGSGPRGTDGSTGTI